MNKGCPKCGSKALISEPIIRQEWGRGRRVAVPITIYKCRCGWRGEWNELKKLKEAQVEGEES